MSGIEIAGIVLGAIPLIISALEHYEGMISPAKAWLDFHGELARAIRGLGVQHTSFELSMEVLLRPITTEEELHDMLANTASKLWKDPDIDRELRRHLGRAYAPYMDTVKDIRRVMLDYAMKLDNVKGRENLDQDGLEAITSQHIAAKVDGRFQKFELSKRVKFTMKRKKLKESLTELESAIGMLDKFQNKAEKVAALEESYRPESHIRCLLPAEAVRKNAKKLYHVLSKTWCSTHSSHSAGLLLEKRLIKRSRRGEQRLQARKAESDVCNTDCFALSLLQSPTAVSKKWLHAEIRITEMDPDDEIPTNPEVKVVIPMASSPLPTLASASFFPFGDPSKLQLVTDLCSVLQNPCHSCLGFCLDDKGSLRGTYDAQQNVTYADAAINLEEILKKPGTLTPQERYSLAITLTSSLLQLSHTPWLEESWNKADIIFPRAKDGSGLIIDVKHPYLNREHKQAPAASIRQNRQANDSPKIVALGIMLLEICYGLPIETLVMPEDLGPNDQLTEISYLQAARRCLMEQRYRQEFSFAFVEAIRCCLQCFMDPFASLLNQEFSKSIEERVLFPLEQERDMLLFGPI